MDLFSIAALLLQALPAVANLFSPDYQKQSMDLQEQQAGIQNLLTMLNLGGAKEQIGLGITEATANVGAYEELVGRFPEYASYQKDVYAAQGEVQLQGLMKNLGTENVAGAVRGFKEGKSSTATVMAQQAKEKVVQFAGSDMALGGASGLYERGLDQLTQDLDAQFRSAQSQLDIWKQTKSTLETTEGLYDTTIAKLEDLLTPEGPAGAAWEYQGSAAQERARERRRTGSRRSPVEWI